MAASTATSPAPVWGKGSVASALSLRWFWPSWSSAKDDHQAELALLAGGGLAVKTPPAGAASGAAAAAALAADAHTEGAPPVGIPAELTDVDIDGTGNYIHTLAIRSAESGPKHSLVMTHGYFTGLGFYYRNFAALSQVRGWDVYAIDWLGMGRSARPPYNSRRTESEDKRVAYAEDFFVESLEEWRRRMGIERMTLCGHSFGGYMSTLYALRYPERVEKLVLVSPIGIPEAPPGYDEALRRGYGLERARRVSKGMPPSSDSTPDYQEPNVAAESPGPMRIALFRTAMALWERNYSPQWLVRNSGPLGRRLINSYVSRFAWLSDAQREALAVYTHQISVLPSSSEAALGDILRPGAFARRPLVSRLAGLAVPAVFMYGASDWVDYTGGQQALHRIGGTGGSLHRVPNAGHNLHLENPDDFNRVVVAEMRAISEAGTD